VIVSEIDSHTCRVVQAVYRYYDAITLYDQPLFYTVLKGMWDCIYIRFGCLYLIKPDRRSSITCRYVKCGLRKQAFEIWITCRRGTSYKPANNARIESRYLEVTTRVRLGRLQPPDCHCACLDGTFHAFPQTQKTRKGSGLGL
jgi:hypothetical protein